MNSSETMLSVIDNRIDKKIGTLPFLKQYSGKVTQVFDEGKKAIVEIIGETSNNNFEFVNKSGEPLSVNDFVYIKTKGNDFNTGVISEVIGTRSIPLNLVKNLPYVVESGEVPITRDIERIDNEGNTISQTLEILWTYQKWSNGIAECWGSLELSLPRGIISEWGNQYISVLKSVINYPFVFLDIPFEQASVRSQDYAYFLLPRGGDYLNTTTSTGDYSICRPSQISTEVNCIVDFNIKGKWK